MAVRLKPFHLEEVRSKIRTSQLLNRLQDHAEGKVMLEPTQVKAVEILLRKTMPDLKAVDLTGNLEVNGSWTVKLG